MLKNINGFIALTKPRIMLLVIAAGATALIVEGSLLQDPSKFILFLFGLYLTGGSANALNQCFERNIDARMKRTSSRRPLPMGRIKFPHAIAFSIIIGLAGIIMLGLIFNKLTAFISVGTIIFYSLVYTLLLKPNTSQNIVIGGVAGAMAPIGAWTAATGTLTATPWLLFLLIFAWTPPHFWSLAVCFKDDYDKVGLPMLPNVSGNKIALNQILFYTILTFLISILLLFANFGWIYLTTSIILGIIFIKKAYDAREAIKEMEETGNEKIWGIFKFSIFYLFSLFLALIVDKFL